MDRMLRAICAVESSGSGFDKKTGRLKIQFEPHIFSRQTRIIRSAHSIWGSNKVESQDKEWAAFLDASSIDQALAIEATSLGAPQILGIHWARLGYANPSAMFDSFATSAEAQLAGLRRFIDTDKFLRQAVIDLDYHRIASIYNGRHYRSIALKNGWIPYDKKLKSAYEALA